MDPHNFDPSNVAASSEVQHALMEDQQADPAEQEAFEQQMAAARLADWAMPDRGPRGSLRPNVSSDGQQSRDELMGALARSNLLPSEEVVINDEHDTAELRPAKRPRTLNNPQGVPIERQLGEIANSGGGGGAMPSASSLQPAQSTGIVVREQWDKRPLYSEDAPVILSLEEALIKGGMTATPAKHYAGSLLSFSRWLFAKNRGSIVARLDSKPLSDDGDVREFTAGKNKRLFNALEHLRTFRSTGVAVPVVRPGRARAKLNSHPQNVTLINPEDAVPIEPRRVGNAAAQHSACSALRPAQSTGIVIGHDMPPLYSEDAPVILGLEGALIKGGMNEGLAKQYASSLLNYSRWLFAENKPSIVARLESKLLSDGGDVFEFIGTGSREKLLYALDHLRTFWSTGAPIVRRNAKSNPPPRTSPASIPKTRYGWSRSASATPLRSTARGRKLAVGPSRFRDYGMINPPRRFSSKSTSRSIQSRCLRGSFGECSIIWMINPCLRQPPPIQRGFSDWNRSFARRFREGRIIIPLRHFPSVQTSI